MTEVYPVPEPPGVPGSNPPDMPLGADSMKPDEIESHRKDLPDEFVSATPAGELPGVETIPASAPPPEPAPAAARANPAPTAAQLPPAQLSPQDERTWAMLAHLSILVNLFTGFLGPVIALVIYFVYKDRSRYVAYQSMQSFVFQMIAWIGGWALFGLAATISGVLMVVLIGCLLMPVALALMLIPLGALVYGVIGALQANQGRDFRYWLVGDWLRDLR